MDKISKRSKGYAFVEYTSEEAATTALQEMNGKVNLRSYVISLIICLSDFHLVRLSELLLFKCQSCQLSSSALLVTIMNPSR